MSDPHHDYIERKTDLRADYAWCMEQAEAAFLLLSPEERAHPFVCDRYSEIKGALASTYREALRETTTAYYAAISP